MEHLGTTGDEGIQRQKRGWMGMDGWTQRFLERPVGTYSDASDHTHLKPIMSQVQRGKTGA